MASRWPSPGAPGALRRDVLRLPRRLGRGCRAAELPSVLEQRAQQQPRGAAAEVGGVVDAGDGEAEEDVQAGPEEELGEEALGLGGEVLAAAEEEGDQGAEDAEDGSRGTGGQARPTGAAQGEDQAGDGAGDAGGEEDQRRPPVTEPEFEQAAQLVERPTVDQQVEHPDVQEHAGHQAPVLAFERPEVGAQGGEDALVGGAAHGDLGQEAEADGDEEAEGDGDAAER